MKYIQALIADWPIYARIAALAGLVVAVHFVVVVIRRLSCTLLAQERNRRYRRYVHIRGRFRVHRVLRVSDGLVATSKGI